MKKRIFGLSLAALMVAAIFVACGGSSSMVSTTTSNAAMGSVVMFGGDAPLCDVVSLQLTITDAELVPASGGASVSLISSANPMTVDFARLMDFISILKLTTVPAGSYSQLKLSLSNPELMVLDVTQTPPAAVSVPSVSLTTSNVTLNLSRTLTVQANPPAGDQGEDDSKDESEGLLLHFDMRKSVQTDSTGQVTGVIDPMFNARVTDDTAEDGIGDVDELHGLVQSVSTTATASFTGSFMLKTEDGTVDTINVTSNTRFEGVTNGLAGLMANQFIEVNAFVDMHGNIVAREIGAEEEESESDDRAAFLGFVTSVTRDSSGNATQFTMWVREEDPELPDNVEKHSVTVNLTSTTFFGIFRNGINEAGLTFNAASLGVAESVAVHGQLQAGPPVSITAGAVFLRPRTVLGNFSTLLAAQGDGVTGGFTMIPCGALFKGQPIIVLTFGDTEFNGVSGLIGLGPQPTIGVRGLVFFEQTSGTANGAAWVAPTWVDEAREVHEFPQ
jgi:uncharacterized protein DUF4382/uncharacterized protein DUF5666